MRLMLVAMGLGAVLWYTPPVEMPGPDAPNALAGHGDTGAFAEAGANSLLFAVAPRVGDPPVMPDIPWPLLVLTPDEMPDTIPGLGPRPTQGAAELLPLGADEEASMSSDRRRITAKVLKLRSGPAKGYRAVSSAEGGEVAVVTGDARNGWLPIRIVGSGQSGWAFHRYLAPIRG